MKKHSSVQKENKMLQIKNISKQYRTGDLVQNALNDVSINLRDNEFVAILGPSGSGKTTLLNIIGGLDRYDSGDLIINNISTKKYKDRDWDSYRNHTIGFVFQSYYLIPHQSVLANVELALTISGISRKERRERATEALKKVGLGDQLHKKPNQMSGGQMQRVAIARALVNNPDILLADEPTGALDTETSVQIMDLLKEVAKDKLVVMVTHNPELAEKYANRIINLKDGKITGDTNPFEVDEKTLEDEKVEYKNLGKASMSIGTAIGLSFSNLRTKLGRTILTSFAGSIGIIGIAMILSLSSGVNKYINDVQRETMTSYPIVIEAQTMDISAFFQANPNANSEDSDDASSEDEDREENRIYSNSRMLEMSNSMTNSITENNLELFREYLEEEDCPIRDYVGENGIIYSYNTTFSVYTYDSTGEFMSTNPFIGGQTINAGVATFSMSSTVDEKYDEILPGQDGAIISDIVYDNYDLIHGEWPTSANEVLLVVNQRNEIQLDYLYELGYLPHDEYDEMIRSFSNGGEIEINDASFTFEEMCDHTLYLMTGADLYVEGDNGYFSYIGDDVHSVEENLANALELDIVGIVRAKPDAESATLYTPIAYTQELTNYIIDHTAESPVVVEQMENPDVNVLNGMSFAPASDEEKAEAALIYIESLTISEKAEFIVAMAYEMYGGDETMLAELNALSEQELAAMFDQMIIPSLDEASLVQIYDEYVSTGSYDENMFAFGYIDKNSPSSIAIYTDTFENKDYISYAIEEYNSNAAEEDKILYNDFIGLALSSVTTIIDVITYILIAFVAISLVVSSIMIGIITLISVMERTKEIGILRAIGASKRNISLVFNAETFIIGLIAGLIGVGVTLLLLIPSNILIHHIGGVDDVNAFLPAGAAAILTLLSVILTLIGGLIPSRKAAKMDPVSALRSE